MAKFLQNVELKWRFFIGASNHGKVQNVISSWDLSHLNPYPKRSLGVIRFGFGQSGFWATADLKFWRFLPIFLLPCKRGPGGRLISSNYVKSWYIFSFGPTSRILKKNLNFFKKQKSLLLQIDFEHFWLLRPSDWTDFKIKGCFEKLYSQALQWCKNIRYMSQLY